MNLFGGVGKVVKGAGKVVETTGEAAIGVVEAVTGHKKDKKKPKSGLEEVIVEQINQDFGDDMDKEDDFDAEMKKYEEELDRQMKDVDMDKEDDFDAEMKKYEEELDRQMKDVDGDQEVDFSGTYVVRTQQPPMEEDGQNFDDPDIDEAEKKLMKFGDEESKEEEEEKEGEESSKIIPKHFSLKSFRNNKYLRYTNQGQNSDGLLRYSSKSIVSPYSKFAVRASKTNPGFVHIRCCYNNKFWVCLSDEDNSVAAIANEEQEDISKSSCTLFELFFVPEKNACYMRHVQLNKYLSLNEQDFLIASLREEDIHEINDNMLLFSAVDWDSIFVLPKYVAFKCNNDKYLEPSGKYLKFSASNVEDPAVVFEVIAMEDGYIRIKHSKSGKYWRRDPNWIWCESIDTTKNDPNTLFWPVKVDNNVVALRNKGNNQFCKRLTLDGKTNCLNAAVSTITETARLEVSEAVMARSIENVEYRVEDARVYGKKILSVSKGVAINKTEVADHVTMKFRYEKKVERMWSSSVSMTFGMTAKYKTKIPTVGSMKFELSFERSSEKTREESEKEKSLEETSETITIAPMSKVKFGAVVSQASCDIPFSYTQRDTLADGTQVTHRFEDGIFTGVSTFDYKFETERLPLWDGENWSKTIDSGAVEEDDESSESD